MRLWHKILIPFLPKRQLVAQWCECCLIAKNISKLGTPNYILVNKITDYPIDHFICYSRLVAEELLDRGYKCDLNKFDKYGLTPSIKRYGGISYNELFANWHNSRYLEQCLYNLEEKYDCGGITETEWLRLLKAFSHHFSN